MVAKIVCGSVRGIEPVKVQVEVDISRGLPSISIVGLADTGIKEAADRVRAAMENSQCLFPRDRITVNLSPAGFRKKGSYFDLPIAMAILGASGQIDVKVLEGTAFIGELSLDGKVVGCDGVLQMVSLLQNSGIKRVILPGENLKEGALVKDIEVLGADSLNHVIDYFLRGGYLPRGEFREVHPSENTGEFPKDFEEVKGQEAAKRAITVAIAGGHDLLMTGSPGSGKTMLAECIPHICPDMTYREMMEITSIYSVAGLLNRENPLQVTRPFRTAGPRTTVAGLLGGGTLIKPGELTLAHRGVLYMDEICEFRTGVLESLRIPLDKREILIRRGGEDYRFPADAILICSTNPCPCGYYGDREHQCTCKPYEIQRYRSKLSGPVKDRIDMHIEVPPVKYGEFKSAKSMSSAEMKAAIVKAREIQEKRYQGEAVKLNGRLDNKLVKKYCSLSGQCREFLETAYSSLRLNPRSLFKVIKMARTCADLEGRDAIEVADLMEALQYREKVR